MAGIGLLGRQAGAHDVDAVELRLLGDCLGLAGEAEAVSFDIGLEVFGHLPLADDSADRLADFGSTTQRVLLPPHALLDAAQVCLGGRQQFTALARAFVSQQRVLADHEPFPGKVRAGDLRHIAGVEQRGLQRPACDGQLLDRRRPQRRDPIQASRPQRLRDAGIGDHAAVSHQDHALEIELLFQLVDLLWHCRRIAGVSLKHLDRHGAAIKGTQQPDDQLRPVATMVPAVAELCQRTAVAFQVGGGDVVQHQHAFLEVAAGEAGFDEGLLADQPVEGSVEFAGGDAAEVEDFAQGMAGGRGVEHPRGGNPRVKPKDMASPPGRADAR